MREGGRGIIKGRILPARPFDDQANYSRHNIVSTAIYKTLKFLTASSLLLALNASMVVAFGFFLYGSIIMPNMLLAAFLVTFAVYGLNKVTDKVEDSINKPELTPKRTNHYLILSIASMIAGLFIGLLEGIVALIVLAIPLIIGVVYSVKISKTIPRLKEIIGVKSLVVAVSWGLPGSLLPGALNFNLLKTGVIFLFVFVRVFVGAVLFDVLDKNGDASSGVETIPIRLGINKTKKLLITINSLSLLLPVYFILNGVLMQFLPALIFGVLYGYLAIWWFYSSKCSRVTAGLMLDGEWLPILIITGLFIIMW